MAYDGILGHVMAEPGPWLRLEKQPTLDEIGFLNAWSAKSTDATLQNEISRRVAYLQKEIDWREAAVKQKEKYKLDFNWQCK